MKLWQLLIILSKSANQFTPLFLKELFNILINIYDYEIILNEDLSDFFQQLNHNYQKLKMEYKELLSINKLEDINDNINDVFQKREIKEENDIKRKSSYKERIRSR